MMPSDTDRIAEAAGAAIQNPFLAGLVGGIVALRGVPGDTWRERAFNALSAMLIAGYMSPAISEFFGLHSPAMQSACAFAVGLFGLNLTATIVIYIQTVKLSDLIPWGKK